MKRQGGKIENWFLNTTMFPGYIVVCGEVHGDEKWPDGMAIRTSAVVKLDLEANTVETMNTIYTLGKQQENFSKQG